MVRVEVKEGWREGTGERRDWSRWEEGGRGREEIENVGAEGAEEVMVLSRRGRLGGIDELRKKNGFLFDAGGSRAEERGGGSEADLHLETKVTSSSAPSFPESLRPSRREIFLRLHLTQITSPSLL